MGGPGLPVPAPEQAREPRSLRFRRTIAPITASLLLRMSIHFPEGRSRPGTSIIHSIVRDVTYSVNGPRNGRRRNGLATVQHSHQASPQVDDLYRTAEQVIAQVDHTAGFLVRGVDAGKRVRLRQAHIDNTIRIGQRLDRDGAEHLPRPDAGSGLMSSPQRTDRRQWSFALQQCTSERTLLPRPRCRRPLARKGWRLSSNLASSMCPEWW